MRPWTALGLIASIGVGFQRGFGYAFTSSKVTSFPSSSKGTPASSRRHAMSSTQLRMASSFDPIEAVKEAMGGDGRVNPVYRQMVVLAVKSGAAGAAQYLDPAGESSTSTGKRALCKAVQAHVGQLMDAVLSPAPDEENAEAIKRILDRCEKQHKGAGATLALGYLDTVWWLPAPIRPAIGALAILAVYEALRRFGVFTRFGMVKLPDTELAPTDTVPEPVEGMEDSPIFKAAQFETDARSLSYYTLIGAFLVSTMSYVISGGDGQVAWSGMLLLTFVAFEREVLHSALYSEAIIRVQPMLTQLTSAHEAGHVAAAYLTGLPVATYTLGGLGSLQHGDEVGCGPSCNIINAELSTAKIWLPEELLTGPASEPEPRLEARMTYPWEDPARLQNLVELDFSSPEIPHKDRVAPFDTEGRHAMSNRMALTSMGGIAGEMMANGFDVGGGADYFNMRRRFKGLWPYMSQDDLRRTEKWAFLENLKIFKAERTAMELLAKNMRERRPIGRMMLDLDRSLTSTEFELSAAERR
ncbi:unnamed protein product [Ectocarpus sp. 12 AP-2014]